MAHLQVTIDTDKLKDLFASDEGMAALAEQVLNQVLGAQMTEHLQAKPYERTDQRRAYRNGYKPRQLTTRVGTLPSSRAASAGRVVLDRSVPALPALGAGSRACDDGGGVPGRVNTQGDEDHRGALRHRLLEEYGEPAVRSAGRAGGRLERAPAQREAVPLPSGRRHDRLRCGATRRCVRRAR